MHNDHANHFQATLGMHTGSFTFARPSIGSWVSYGLGTVNRNLPSFIVLAPQLPYAGGAGLGLGLPAGLPPGHARGAGPGPDAEHPARVSRRPTCRSWSSAWPQAFNRRHLAAAPGDANLAARIRSFETAFGMQAAAPEAFDLSQESDATLTALRSAARQHPRLRLAMPGRPAPGRARRALHRADRHRRVEQLGLARQHERPLARWRRTSISRSPACSWT